MNTKTSEEAKRDLISSLGEENGTLVDNLKNDCVNLRLYWRVYCSFFGTNQERVDLLNSISGTTSIILENSLRHEVIFRICRLTDPESAQRGERKNVSLSRLENIPLSDQSVEMKKKINIAKQSSSFAKTLRNRLLAHSDDIARNYKMAPISQGSRKDIENAIDDICDCIRFFYSTALDTHLVTRPSSTLISGEVELIKAIFLGSQERNRLEQEQSEFLAQRDYKSLEDQRDRLPEWVTFRETEFKDG